MDETFTQLPLHMDPSSKAISAPQSSQPSLQAELQALNELHTAFKNLETPVPPPPVPVNPKRSAQITKLRESGNTHYKKGAYSDAIQMYTLGIKMALGRPMWEPSGLTREEASGLYANRAQAYMATQNWPEGAVDAEASVECKRVGNPKAWWRRGRCLLEMGRYEECQEWVKRGLELEGNEQDLVGLMKEVEEKLAKKN
jgi:translocation protein SEC72